MSNLDLESVIEDSLTDATTLDATDAPVEGDTPAEGTDTTPTDEVAPEGTDDSTEVSSSEVSSPAGRGAAPAVEDEFAKRHGLPQQGAAGRENRIPYTRVKKIVDKAEKEAVAKAQKEWETKTNPTLAEFQGKVQDYEGRLEKVAQFEHVMVNQPQEFLEMLSKVPAYKEFFDWVRQAASAGVQQQPAEGAAGGGMPQPDEQLADGTMVYSMEGLQKLQDWQGKQIEGRLTKAYDARLAEVQKRYDPIRQRYEQEQHLAAIVPQIQRQIDEARQWPQFTENEEAITAALQANPNLSLEGAYRQVVIPKFQSSRDSMRTSILAEIQKKPVSSGTPVRGATRPTQVANNQHQSMEDLIKAQIDAAGLK